MKIINFITGEIYFDGTEDGKEVRVSEEFWVRLNAGEVLYRDGGERDDVFYTDEVNLKVNDANFEEIFWLIANSEIGKRVIVGYLPVDTIL